MVSGSATQTSNLQEVKERHLIIMVLKTIIKIHSHVSWVLLSKSDILNCPDYICSSFAS